MSNTVFTVKSALATVTAYQSATPEQDLKFAQALLFLTTADPKTYSVRGLVTVSANLSRPVGKSRIATLIKAARTLPETPTVTDWQAAIAAASAANRGRETAATVPPVDTDAESGAENALVTAARAITAPTPAVTVEDAIRALWESVEAFGDDPQFIKALDSALSFVVEPIAA